MRFIGILIALSVPMASVAASCDKHPINCHIRTLRSDLDPADSMRLSNVLHEVAAHYKLDPKVLVAVLYQESRIDESIAMVVHKNGSIDLGLAQINKRTAKDYGLDITKLMADSTYSLWAMGLIMRRKVNVCKRLGRAKGTEWSCYHSYTTKHRRVYERQVRRFL